MVLIIFSSESPFLRYVDSRKHYTRRVGNQVPTLKLFCAIEKRLQCQWKLTIYEHPSRGRRNRRRYNCRSRLSRIWIWFRLKYLNESTTRITNKITKSNNNDKVISRIWRVLKYPENFWSRPSGKTKLKENSGVKMCAYNEWRDSQDRDISEMVTLRKKIISTFFVDNSEIYNFCLKFFLIKLTVYEKNPKTWNFELRSWITFAALIGSIGTFETLFAMVNLTKFCPDWLDHSLMVTAT